MADRKFEEPILLYKLPLQSVMLGLSLGLGLKATIFDPGLEAQILGLGLATRGLGLGLALPGLQSCTSWPC